MFEIYISFIMFSVVLIIIYKKFFENGYETGEWLTVNKDIKIEYEINWDISEKSVIRVLNFSKWKKYFMGIDLFTNINNKGGIYLKFEEDCVLDVCDNMMNNIYNIVNPSTIIFSNQDNKYHYNLSKDKKYIFFLRTNKEKNLNIKTKKYSDINNNKEKILKHSNQICCIDEDNLFQEFYKKCEDIKTAMLKRNYNLVKIGKSEEYLSFPNNSISNKLTIEVELGDVIILVTTNKKFTSEMKNHLIEVNSENNNFVWEPSSNENISFLLLDNCDQDDTFNFYERTTNVKNGSNLLPFQVFSKGFNIIIVSSAYCIILYSCSSITIPSILSSFLILMVKKLYTCNYFVTCKFDI